MVQVLQAKLEQHPRLVDAISKRGGTEWLENCTAVATTGGTPATHCLTNITNAQDKQWEGKGKESAFIRALTEAYTNVVEKSQQTTVSPHPSSPTPPASPAPLAPPTSPSPSAANRVQLAIII